MMSTVLNPDMLTTIKLDHKTRERLANLGKKNESYDTILNRLMDLAEKKG